MIPSFAVKKFLNRPRRDYRGWKQFDDEKLQRLCDKLPIRPPIWSVLNREQKICFLIGVRESRFLFWLDTGMGKSLLSMALHRYFQKLGTVKRSLVLVPYRINRDEWVDEVTKHTRMTVQVLSGSSENKWDQLLNSKTDLVVCTFMGLVRMVCKVAPNKKGRNRLVPVMRLVKLLQAQFEGLFMDESTHVKNKMKLPYRVCRWLSMTCKAVFALTGTPFGTDPTDLWSQFYLVDHGETMGETLGLMRAAFFREVDGYFATTFEFNHKNKALLNAIMANKSIRFKADPATMPEVKTIVKYIDLPKGAEAYYKAAKEQLERAHGNYEEQKNAFIRMRQISSGFVGYNDDETGRRAQFDFKPNPKLELVLSIIESIPSDRKIIVYHEFIFSGSMLERRLDDMGIQYAHIYGGVKDTKAELQRFKKDADVQVLLLQNAMAIGLNLQVAQYGIRYEVPVSLIQETQAKRRFIRQHSEFAQVFLYDLIVRGTYDQRILDRHEDGRSLFAALIDASPTRRKG